MRDLTWMISRLPFGNSLPVELHAYRFVSASGSRKDVAAALL